MDNDQKQARLKEIEVEAVRVMRIDPRRFAELQAEYQRLSKELLAAAVIKASKAK